MFNLWIWSPHGCWHQRQTFSDTQPGTSRNEPTSETTAARPHCFFRHLPPKRVLSIKMENTQLQIETGETCSQIVGIMQCFWLWWWCTGQIMHWRLAGLCVSYAPSLPSTATSPWFVAALKGAISSKRCSFVIKSDWWSKAAPFPKWVGMAHNPTWDKRYEEWMDG